MTVLGRRKSVAPDPFIPFIVRTSGDMKHPRTGQLGPAVITARRRLFASLLVLALSFTLPVRGECAPTATYDKERVTFESGNLTLVGFVFKPSGPGPFPGLVWNHGSERNPDSGAQFDAIAAVFVPAGYAVFAPMRRGHGDSEGPYMEHALQRSRGEERGRLQVRLLEGEQLDDQLAGLAYFKSLPYVDQNRLAVAGCSYGGIQSLLAAERGAGYKAAVAISPAALSWAGNPVLQDRLVLAAQRTEIPVFLIQPPRDASLEPSRVLGREFQRSGRRYKGKIYPSEIQGDLQTHCFGGIARGSHVWASDVLDFLAEVLR
jgi:carboxymethylenebutenolidase